MRIVEVGLERSVDVGAALSVARPSLRVETVEVVERCCSDEGSENRSPRLHDQASATTLCSLMSLCCQRLLPAADVSGADLERYHSDSCTPRYCHSMGRSWHMRQGFSVDQGYDRRDDCQRREIKQTNNYYSLPVVSPLTAEPLTAVRDGDNYTGTPAHAGSAYRGTRYVCSGHHHPSGDPESIRGEQPWCEHSVGVCDHPMGIGGVVREPAPNTVFWYRSMWLVCLLGLQSASGYVLEQFDTLLSTHACIVLFLTMLVGAGGNAGSQSTVLMVRRLANRSAASSGAVGEFVWTELWTGLKLAAVLAAACYVRVQWLTSNSLQQAELVGLCGSMFAIVTISVTTGTLLPLLLWRLGYDPAYASAATQVVADLAGVTLTCIIMTVTLTFIKTRASDLVSLRGAQAGLDVDE